MIADGRTDWAYCRHTNVTLDDSSASFSYLPADSWSLLSNDDGGGNYSVALGSGPDAKADLTFKGTYRTFTQRPCPETCELIVAPGSAVYLYGRTGPNLGEAQVMLDGQAVAHLNMTVSHITLEE